MGFIAMVAIEFTSVLPRCTVGTKVKKPSVHTKLPDCTIQRINDGSKTSPNNLTVGCHTHTIEKWIENAQRIGSENGYTNLEIQEYLCYFNMAKQLKELREEPK